MAPIQFICLVDRIFKCSQGVEAVWSDNFRMGSLRLAEYEVLLVLSVRDLQKWSRVAGLSLRDRVRSSAVWEGPRSRAVALSNQEESDEVVRASS